MFALIKKEEKIGYDYQIIDIPEPKEGEILVKVEKVSVCGSDVNLYKWNEIAKKIAELPFIPGLCNPVKLYYFNNFKVMK